MIASEWFRVVGLGLLGGVLVNYLADVLPITRRLSKPLWWPVKSISQVWAYLRQIRVWLVLVGVTLLFSALELFPQQSWPTWQLGLIVLYFTLIIVIDIEHRLILHPLTIAGALLFAALGFGRHGIESTLLGGIAGFVILYAFYLLGDVFGRLLARRRGEEWEEIALGFGDVNLAGVIGLLLGWPAVFGGLLVAVFLGGFFSLAYILVSLLRGRYRAFAAIPYGPFLALGAMLLIAIRAY